MAGLQKEGSGIIFSTAIGLVAYFLSPYLPSTFNSILLALLLGIVIGNAFSLPEKLSPGISFTGGKLLEFSIIFLAFSINYSHIAQLGAASFTIIAIVVLFMLFFTLYLSKKIECPGATGWLIGFGTSICGSSAIAALAPGVTKNKDEIGISMAVVNLFGTLGMILLPIILVKFELSHEQVGLLIGGSLHSVGNVVGAGYSISNEVGETSITIKLARVALLSPALLIFNYLVNRKEVKNWKQHFSLPWYLWSFILITLISTLIHFPKELVDQMETTGKIILTIAMAAIGLKVSFKQIIQSGKKGIIFGTIVLAIQLALLTGFMLLI